MNIWEALFVHHQKIICPLIKCAMPQICNRRSQYIIFKIKLKNLICVTMHLYYKACPWRCSLHFAPKELPKSYTNFMISLKYFSETKRHISGGKAIIDSSNHQLDTDICLNFHTILKCPFTKLWTFFPFLWHIESTADDEISRGVSCLTFQYILYNAVTFLLLSQVLIVQPEYVPLSNVVPLMQMFPKKIH